jgi:hypothetical protein
MVWRVEGNENIYTGVGGGWRVMKIFGWRVEQNMTFLTKLTCKYNFSVRFHFIHSYYLKTAKDLI